MALAHFDLKDAHPAYKVGIERILCGLADKYPWAGLRYVGLFEPTDVDRSLGRTEDGGKIYFNKRWFTQPPYILNEASRTNYKVLINGQEVLWHGKMLQEPLHVCTHEFGHVIAQQLPEYRDLAKSGWKASTTNNEHAVSGYALANPDEWWAETFCAVELGCGLPGQAESLYDLIENR